MEEGPLQRNIMVGCDYWEFRTDKKKRIVMESISPEHGKEIRKKEKFKGCL